MNSEQKRPKIQMTKWSARNSEFIRCKTEAVLDTRSKAKIIGMQS